MQKRHTGLQRLVAHILVLCLGFSCVPLNTLTPASAEVAQTPPLSQESPVGEQDSFFDRVSISIDGQEALYAELDRNEYLTLIAQFQGEQSSYAGYTWQIYNPVGGTWAAISGAEGNQLKIGAALLENMTDEAGMAVVNCKVTAEGTIYYSNAVSLILKEEEQVPEEAQILSAPVVKKAASYAALQNDTSGGELVTHTVSVEYLNYITGNDAAKSYIATVKPDTVGLTVYPDSPIVVGFTPYIITKGGIKGAAPLQEGEDGASLVYEYVDGSGVSQKIYGIETHKLALDLSNVTADITYHIVYMPNRVFYTVSHYVQNIVNDDYVLYYVETKEGYVGQMTQATDLSKAHPTSPDMEAPLKNGFAPLLPFRNQEIAADGTTQISTYYDRLYYLMTYKLDGGRGTEPVYARYGTILHTPDPEKPGYTFAGWVKLQMDNATDSSSSPRPITENGAYIPLYTDENGVVQMENGEFVRLTLGNDGKYYGPDGNPYTLLSSDKLPKTMPAFHSAMMAVWEQATDTNYTVVYWLEKADRSTTGDTLTKSDYDYLTAKTIQAPTGTVIDQNYIIDYGPDGTGAYCESTETTIVAKQALTQAFLRQLDGKKFVIVSARNPNIYMADKLHSGTTDRLQSESFSASNPGNDITEWTFEAYSAANFQYYIHCNGKYIRKSGGLSLVDRKTDATVFTLQYNSSQQTVYLDGINQWAGGSASQGFGIYGGTEDGGNYYNLYVRSTQTAYQLINDANYFYYVENDMSAENNNLTVSADGKTTVNVFYRRREYNLRFFYARSSGSSNNLQYQVVGGSINNFSILDNTTTEGLVESIPQSQWGTVSEPKLSDPNSYYTLGTFTDSENLYTYYYFIFKARYGQNIADEWPSDVMQTVTRTTANGTSHGWDSTTAVFSAWGGEYWLKYECNQRNSTHNYTIKGNYQVLDENLLYDASFNNTHPAEALDSNGMRNGYYYERGTGVRNLDFIAFYENGADINWSIPRQFHYYLWVEAPDQSLISQGSTYNKQKLPHNQTDFDDAQEGVTTAIINDKLYVLYDKVNVCDNAPNPSEQTTIGIAGYDYAGSGFGSSYPTYANAIQNGLFYYQNISDDPNIPAFDSSVYQQSYSLNFAYSAQPHNITLQSWNHIRTLDNIPYNSMDGAKLITGQYADDPEHNYDPGYLYDSMMANYYPEALPEGAYYFAGWYKTPDYIPGTEANFDKGMPNYNIMLYAKWEPLRFDVEVYQTSDRSSLVYYPSGNTGITENLKMQALVEYETVSIHGQNVQVGKEGTGKGYGEYLPAVVPAAGPDKTYTGIQDGKPLAAIPENCSPLDYANGSGEIRSRWIFVCYAYLKDGVEHAIDISSFTITEDVQVFAKWTAVDILNYRVEYAVADLEVRTQEDGAGGIRETLWAKRHQVYEDGSPRYEDGRLVYTLTEEGDPVYEQVTYNSIGRLAFADGTEWVPTAKTVMQDSITPIYVAEPLTGKVNEGANRTFTAKTGTELYTDFQAGYFPVHISHTMLMQYGEPCTCCQEPVLIGSDEQHPLVASFYYVPLTNVPYRVQYLDKFGNAVIDLNNNGIYTDDIYGQVMENGGANMQMVVTEKYRYRAGYAPDAFQKTLVLSANTAENIITFLYEKADGMLPYTVEYYYETLGDVVDSEYGGNKYLLHHQLSGSIEKDQALTVDYLDMTGFEYAADQVSRFTQQDLSKQETQTTTDRGNRAEIATGKTSLSLTDLRGHKVTVTAENNAVTFQSDDSHNHNLDNSIFTYLHQDISYRVTDVHNVGGLLVLDGYANPTGSFQATQGQYGTVVKVYYNLKKYPYYIIHKVDGTDKELSVELGTAKFQSVISGFAMTDEALIEYTPSYAGYTARDEDKHITVTMTIQDDGSTPHINTITFLYYEKMMEFDYVPMLLKNSQLGESGSQIVHMPENEPNAQINLVRDYIKTVTGTADAAHPIIYEEAYEFLGWYLDAECTRPVANSGAAVYLGTDYIQDENGNSSLTGQLTGTEGTMTQEQYKLYDTLLPQKKETDYQYWDADTATVQKTDLENGVYVGGFNQESHTYEQTETFYALFAPKLGNLTISRTNTGTDLGHHEANSFVYTLRRVSGDGKDFSMQVTLGPEDFTGNTASVEITNLPIGEYTVTQENNWSWRYSDAASAQVSITGNALYHTVTFGKEMTVLSWLTGFAQTLKNVCGIN